MERAISKLAGPFRRIFGASPRRPQIMRLVTEGDLPGYLSYLSRHGKDHCRSAETESKKAYKQSLRFIDLLTNDPKRKQIETAIITALRIQMTRSKVRQDEDYGYEYERTRDLEIISDESEVITCEQISQAFQGVTREVAADLVTTSQEAGRLILNLFYHGQKPDANEVNHHLGPIKKKFEELLASL